MRVRLARRAQRAASSRARRRNRTCSSASCSTIAEAAAGETRIEDVGVDCVRRRRRRVRPRRRQPARWPRSTHRRRPRLAELGEAVDPPVAGERARAPCARGGTVAVPASGGSHGSVAGGGPVVDAIAAPSARGERIRRRPIIGAQRRLVVGLYELPAGQPQRVRARGSGRRRAGARPRRAARAVHASPGVAPAASVVVHQLPVQRAAVRRRARSRAAPALRALPPMPANGRNTSGIFQALALVQGHDLHAARVGFQAQQLGFVVGARRRRCARASQSTRPCRPSARASRFLQQFGQLQVVGEAALAVEQAEQAAGVSRAQVADQRQRAAALPGARARPARSRLPAARRRRRRRRARRCRRRPADQHRRQRRAQAAVVGAVQQGRAAARARRAPRAWRTGSACRRRPRECRPAPAPGCMRVASACASAPAPRCRPAAPAAPSIAGVAGARVGEHRVDRGDAGVRWRVRAIRRGAVRLAPCRCRRGRRRAARAQVSAGAVAPLRRKSSSSAARRRAALRGSGCAHRRRRCPAAAACAYSAAIARSTPGRERKLRASGGAASACALGGEVGVDVAAAEAVDRLLGIADQEQRARVAARPAPNTRSKIAPLARIGVLEFVDQRDRVLRAQAPRPARRLRAFQRVGDARRSGRRRSAAALLLERVRGARARRRAAGAAAARGARPATAATRSQRVESVGSASHRSASRACGPCRPCWSCAAACRGCRFVQLARAANGTAGSPASHQVFSDANSAFDPVGLVAAAVAAPWRRRRRPGAARIVAVRAARCRERIAGRRCSRGAGSGHARRGPAAARGSRTSWRQVAGQRCRALRPQREQVVGRVARRRHARATGRRRCASRSRARWPAAPARRSAWPVSSACSRSTRAQKPWMVKIAARSMSSAARAQARVQRGCASSPLRAGCAAEHGVGSARPRRASSARRRIDQLGGQQQARADARAQFLGGRFGEGHREDLAERAARVRPPGARPAWPG